VDFFGRANLHFLVTQLALNWFEFSKIAFLAEKALYNPPLLRR